MQGDSLLRPEPPAKLLEELLKELKSDTLSEPVELADNQLDMVAGGRAHGFVKERNSAAPDPT